MYVLLTGETVDEKWCQQSCAASPLVAQKMGSAAGIALLDDLYQKYPNEMVENPRLMKFAAECFLHNQKEDKFMTNKRLRAYLVWRRESFGDLDDHTMDSNILMAKQIACGYMSILPQRLPDGTAVVFMRQRFHQPLVFNTKQTLQYFHFMLMTAIIKDPTLASCGVVIINNYASSEPANSDTNTTMAVLNALKNFLPVRLVNMIGVNLSMGIRLLAPIVTTFISGCTIASSPAEVPNIMSCPISFLPVELGGEVEVPEAEAVLKQLIDENNVTV